MIRNSKPVAAPSKMTELGKALAKHGHKGIEGKSGYEKMLADKRISDLVKPRFDMDPSQAIKELPADKHLRYDYINSLLNKVENKAQVKAVIDYIKSAAANNLTTEQRARLLLFAFHKLKYIDIISQLLH